MNTIKVDKAELIKTVTENRDAHRDQFLRAQEKFREKMIELLDQRLRDAREGRQIVMGIQLPVPQDYTDSYDTVLAMLEWERSDVVDLNRQDFERYVENNWEWSGAFAGTTGTYLAGE